MKTNRHATGASVRMEPTCTRVVLRGCTRCRAPHPLARTPPAADGECPDCGHPSRDPGPPEDAPALLIGGPFAWLANALLAIGRKLRAFAQEP